ncbi:hypothetical protein THAOC_00488 [Thalassiosira oceanica]|uniref:Uncharacterized protein n=1 Tax=Thalassiosira oceanica TaxID=159749 RepID=K0TJ68_THAOC|nr:hypothetical protein THAOC_00488 [Thalassiosira oceanica]|eukprot:EJK77665.1 hypothetical protein THAOC_00488 [Thalassiosira oceanica]
MGNVYRGVTFRNGTSQCYCLFDNSVHLPPGGSWSLSGSRAGSGPVTKHSGEPDFQCVPVVECLNQATIAVGAMGNYNSGYNGGAYIYENSDGDWNLQAELTMFGLTKVVVSGDILATGLGEADGGCGTGSGIVRVYRRSGRTWTQQASIADPGCGNYNAFGSSLDMREDMLIVGQPYYGNSGRVYIFRQSSNDTWPLFQQFEGLHQDTLIGNNVVLGDDNHFMTSSQSMGDYYYYEGSDGPSTSSQDSPQDLPVYMVNLFVSEMPSSMPSVVESDMPSLVPSLFPSVANSDSPSTLPSEAVSLQPSHVPSAQPSNMISSEPSAMPSTMPSSELETGMQCVSNLAALSEEFGVPACPVVGMSCTTEGTGLHVGRGGKGGDATSNTLDDCVDGSSGTYMIDESNESVEITSADERLVAGKLAYIVAKVHAWGSGTSDGVDFYLTTNPRDDVVVWTKIGGTKQPPAGGFHFLRSDNFTIPAAADQAVRVVFRYGGSANSCAAGSGGYNDMDDLVYTIKVDSSWLPQRSLAVGPDANLEITSNAELRQAMEEYLDPDTRDATVSTYGPIESWGVSAVEDFTRLFAVGGVGSYTALPGASTFNDDISGWDVSSGTDFSWMFFLASSFNQDISGFDVSKGTSFNHVFFKASSFDQDISGWDVSKGTTFSHMFNRAFVFNQDISGWDVSKGTDFNGMFGKTDSFNQDISGWDVSSGSTRSMFLWSKSFNQELCSWGSHYSSSKDYFDMFKGSSCPIKSQPTGASGPWCRQCVGR